MSENTIDIVVIQTPTLCVKAEDPDNCAGYLSALTTFYQYNSPIAVKDTADFIIRITARTFAGMVKIKNLVIGSHGHGGAFAYFRIGDDLIDNGSPDLINSLKVLAPFFAKDADVFILACSTGQSRNLLRKISTALGGVRVHGYDDRVETDGITLSGGGKRVVCIRSNCTNADEQFPDRKNSPMLEDIHQQTHWRF